MRTLVLPPSGGGALGGAGQVSWGRGRLSRVTPNPLPTHRRLLRVRSSAPRPPPARGGGSSRGASAAFANRRRVPCAAPDWPRGAPGAIKPGRPRGAFVCLCRGPRAAAAAAGECAARPHGNAAGPAGETPILGLTRPRAAPLPWGSPVGALPAPGGGWARKPFGPPQSRASAPLPAGARGWRGRRDRPGAGQASRALSPRPRTVCPGGAGPAAALLGPAVCPQERAGARPVAGGVCQPRALRAPP